MGWKLAIGVIGVVGAVLALVGAPAGVPPTAPIEDADVPVDLVGAKRRDITDRLVLRGLVGFGPSYTIGARADGVVTAAPRPGTVIRPGDELIRVDERPIHLADGTLPLYRELFWRSGDPLEGHDVRQLQRFLASHGYEPTIDGVFGRQTRNAVRDWERSTGHEPDGRVDAAQIVFHDGAVRVVDAGSVGAAFSDIEVSAAAPLVKVRTGTEHAAMLMPGAEATFDHPLIGEIPGRIDDVTAVVEADGRTAVEVTISPTRQLPSSVVELRVTIERIIADDVVAIPARALLPMADGTWTVELQIGDRLERREVAIGPAANGWVAITAGLGEGDLVAVPI